MIKEIISENRRKFINAGIIMGCIMILCILFGIVGYIRESQNDRAATAVLEQLTYTENNSISETELLKEQISKTLLSTEVKGKLYKAMAEISYMSGDDIEYNDNVSSALFYLKKADASEDIANLYIKYIGRLYANGCYDAASSVLDELNQAGDIENFHSDTQVSYFLAYADVREMLEEKDEAMNDLDRAQKVIDSMENQEYKKLYQAKHDLLMARIYVNENEFDKAEACLLGYNIDETFDLPKDNVYVICDYRIAYLEVKAKIMLYRGETETDCQYIDEYLQYCDDYNFPIMKLRLLQYIVGDEEVKEATHLEKYRNMEIIASKETLEILTKQYGEFLLVDIDNSMKDLQNQSDKNHKYRTYLIESIVIIFILIILVCGIMTLISYLNKDGLTRLNNRKVYEHDRYEYEKHGVPYYLLMLDIDDFKKVNDTFGHLEGDIVLKKIADIIRYYTNQNISAYRYGGEEMCMVFRKCEEETVRDITEEIRLAVEHEVGTEQMPLTISGGVGISEKGENVFQVADRCLYYSKEHGKNQICWKA